MKSQGRLPIILGLSAAAAATFYVLRPESAEMDPTLKSTTESAVVAHVEANPKEHVCQSGSCSHSKAEAPNSYVDKDDTVLGEELAFLVNHAVGSKRELSAQVGQTIRNARYVGDRLRLDLGSFNLEGRVQAVHTEGTLTNIGIDLENDLGRAIFAIHDRGEVQGNILLNGRSEAYEIAGDYENTLTLTDSTVSSILCAPSNATYPLSGNSGFLAENTTPRQSIVNAQASFTQVALSSLPDSEYVIYIDFDGESVTSPWWNGGNTIDAEPHPQASNESWVTVVWQRVAEDFAPFDINVTTDRVVFNSAEISKRVMCVVTPTNTAAPGAGGVAFLNTFGDNVPCWTFNLSEYACADTISHEIGHTLGLVHDGQTGDGDQYYDGHGTGEIAWAAIMGASFQGGNENVTQWSIGEYSNAVNYFSNIAEENTQDDLQVIADNGFGYRPDDGANSASNLADGLNSIGAIVDDSGVIETTGDIDFFRFSSLSGVFSITASPLDVDSNEGEGGSNTLGANLAVDLVLYDSDGNPIQTESPTNSLGASITTTLDEGEYYISVQGVGRGDPTSTGFTDYASLGQYFLTGTLSTGPLSVSGGILQDTLIVDGDTTPQIADGTALGIVSITNAETLESTFNFENTGNDEVTISDVSFEGSAFNIDVVADIVLPAGTSESRTVTFEPEDIGIQSDTITVSYFEAGDPGRIYEYTFAIQAVVTKTDDDDNYEENDNFFSAFSLPENRRLVNILGDGRQKDNDWYQISVQPEFNELTINCTFEHDEGDINISLYDPKGYLLTTAITSTDNETITFVVDDEGGQYYIHVFGESNSNTYDLIWEGLSPSVFFFDGSDDNYESNNNFFSAQGKAAFLPKGDMLSNVDGLGVQLDPDWYKITVEPDETEITINVTNTSFVGSVYFNLYDDRGYLKATAFTDGLAEVLVFEGEPGKTTYYIEVLGDNSGANYDVMYDDAPSAISTIGDDNYENNDTFYTAFDLTANKGLSLSSLNNDGVQLDNDWFKVTLSGIDNVIEIDMVNVSPLVGDEAALVFTFYDGRGYPVFTRAELATDETLLLKADRSGGSYYFHFGGANKGDVYDFIWDSRFVPEGDDIYEDNDTRLTAFDLSAEENSPLSRISETAVQSDPDWYQIRAQIGDTGIRARINFAHDEGDLTFALYDSDGDLVSESATATDNEFITAPIPEVLGGDEVYFLEVTGPNEGTVYDLSWSAVESLADDDYEPNNEFESAFPLPDGFAGNLADLSGLGIQADTDFYVINVPTGAIALQVFARFIHDEGDIDIAIYNSELVLLGFSPSVTDNEFLQVSAPSARNTLLYIEVYFANAGNEYDLEWSFVVDDGDDDDEGSRDADLDFLGDSWENKYFGRLTAINSATAESNTDNDLLPAWAEYAMDTNPEEADSSLLQPYVEDGYFRVKFKRSKQAAEAGYRFTVLESANLSFDNPGQSIQLVDETVDFGDYEEVVFRSNHSVDNVSTCFFRLKIEQPE